MEAETVSEKISPEAPPLPEISTWFRGLHDEWPAVFPKERLSELWTTANRMVQEAGRSPKGDEGRALLYHLLKVGLLHRLRGAVNQCTACGLHVHRIPNRGVLEDGDPIADPFGPEVKGVITGPASSTLLILGSHPGPLEGRTALPYTSTSVLAGSMCGSRCAQYESCYPKGAATPQAPCTPKWLAPPTGAPGPAFDRALEPLAQGDPGANILDRALLDAGEWRSGWNERQRHRTAKPGQEPREGTVYLTDLVKCPTGGPAPGEPGRPAKAEEIKACRIWLEIQLAILRPKAILALGKAAEEQVVNLKQATGQPFSGPHPRWIARQPKEQRPPAVKKLVQAIRDARAATVAPPAAAPAVVESGSSPPGPTEGADPLAPRDATFVPTFPDPETEAEVKTGPPA